MLCFVRVHLSCVRLSVHPPGRRPADATPVPVSRGTCRGPRAERGCAGSSGARDARSARARGRPTLTGLTCGTIECGLPRLYCLATARVLPSTLWFYGPVAVFHRTHLLLTDIPPLRLAPPTQLYGERDTRTLRSYPEADNRLQRLQRRAAGGQAFGAYFGGPQHPHVGKFVGLQTLRYMRPLATKGKVWCTPKCNFCVDIARVPFLAVLYCVGAGPSPSTTCA